MGHGAVQPAATFGDGQAVDMDLAVEDALGSKEGAICTRLEARDFIDVDAIRQSGRFTDEQLLQMAETCDDGFDRATYATQLRQVSRVRDGRFADHGTSGPELAALRKRILDWANTIAPTPADQRSRQMTVSPTRRTAAKRPWPTDQPPGSVPPPRRESRGPNLS